MEEEIKGKGEEDERRAEVSKEQGEGGREDERMKGKRRWEG